VTKMTIKWTKRIILVLAIIPILLFLAFAGAVSLIDFNQYKPQIEQEVTKLTNRDFKIDGKVEVSVLPFKFHLGKLALKNTEGYGAENLMTMKEAQIELSLRELFLAKKLIITSLELIEPKLDFVQTATGNNWNDIPILAGFFKPEKLAVLNRTDLSDATLKSGLMRVISDADALPPVTLAPIVSHNWTFESVVISNAEISYRHTVQDFTVSLKQANLLTLDVRPNRPFKINSDFRYEHSDSPRSFNFQINGHLLLANDYTQLHLTNWNGIFNLQLPKERNLPDIRLATQGKNLMVDFFHQQIYVNEAVLEGLDARVGVNFQGEFGAKPAFEGVFEAQKINIQNWLKRLGLPAPNMVNPETLTNAEGKFNWRWDGKSLELKQLDMAVDNSTITGELSCPNDAAQSPVTFSLLVDKLIMEDYLVNSVQPQSTQSQATQNDSTRPGDSKNPSQQASFYPLPLEVLQSLHVNGDVTFTQFTALNIKASKLLIDVSARNGKIALAPMDVEFQQGELQSKFLVDLADSKMHFQWKGRVKDTPLSQFSKAVNLAVIGNVNSHFSLKTQGIDADQQLTNLAGVLNANIDQAKVYGLDINQVLQGELNLSNQKSVTEFEEVIVNGRFDQGVFTPKRLLARSEEFDGSGQGQVDLVNQTVEGELLVTIKEASNALTELKGLALPLQFSGPISQPEWKIDLAQLSPAVLKQSSVLRTLQTMTP